MAKTDLPEIYRNAAHTSTKAVVLSFQTQWYRSGWHIALLYWLQFFLFASDSYSSLFVGHLDTRDTVSNDIIQALLDNSRHRTVFNHVLTDIYTHRYSTKMCCALNYVNIKSQEALLSFCWNQDKIAVCLLSENNNAIYIHTT